MSCAPISLALARCAPAELGRGEIRSAHLMLIRRLARPYENRYALPGGFVREEESPDGAANRELRDLREGTGVEKVSCNKSA
jgi:ADP-ribose pyrophosphatase YjhB (NUDIX family)